MTASTVEPWLIKAVQNRVREFTGQLRQAEGATAIPNLDWNVAELAQHVACLPSFWQGQHDSGSTFERPDDFAAFSDQARSHITDTDTNVLADRVDHEFSEFLETVPGQDVRWLYGVATRPTHTMGMALNELILHGRDLAQVTGAEPPMFERTEANAAIDAIMMTTPCFIDEAKATAQPDGVYHLSFRGGNEYTWTKRGGNLTIELGRPERADARLNADPASFLLSSLGRISQVRAGATGKIIAYGRKPWRFLGLGTIAVDGV